MAENRTAIHSADAPAAIGPYSQAVVYGDLLFCSGQIPVDPASGELVGSDAAEQARVCLDNLSAVCRAAGADLSDALKVTIFLMDLGEFVSVNQSYASYFPEVPPARSTVQVAALPKGALVEIDAIVALKT